MAKEWHIDTKCIQEGWKPGNGEPRVLPIYQSTTFKYDDAQTLGDLFDLKIAGDFYTRLSNPTTNAVENTLVACIMCIGRDHTELLGDTYAAIAGEKCGILKNNCTVISYPAQPQEAMEATIETGKAIIIYFFIT